MVVRTPEFKTSILKLFIILELFPLKATFEELMIISRLLICLLDY